MKTAREALSQAASDLGDPDGDSFADECLKMLTAAGYAVVPRGVTEAEIDAGAKVMVRIRGKWPEWWRGQVWEVLEAAAEARAMVAAAEEGGR